MNGTETFLDGRVTLHPGDCLDVLARLPKCSIDSCVTDPPYHLTSIVQRFGAEGAAPAKSGKSGVYARSSRGFMGKQWDGGEIAFEPETWAAVLRVLKPGGHLLAFGAPKNFGFMQYAIAQAGFEIRDVLAWIFGSGFPKSHNIGSGWGTALKPAYEPIIMARKPLIGTVAENVLTHGTGAINVDGCRVAGEGNRTFLSRHAGARPRDQYRTGTVSGSVPTDLGRWPANLVHDGSEEVVGVFPAESKSGGNVISPPSPKTAGIYGEYARDGKRFHGHADSGSAARFFYAAKADSDDRIGSKHPTVKPVDLMQWLVRLVTPPKGIVCDPFAGTGTTGEAAFREGMRAVLIEREPEYQADIRRRMALVLAGPDERRHETLKAAGKVDVHDNLPLFAGN